jgi:nicotinamidase-related amidase
LKALLVIDVQNGVFRWEGATVHGGDSFLAAVNRLIASARSAQAPIVFVQHQDEWLIPGSEFFELVGDLDVRPEDDIAIVKSHGSAFHDTSLESTLRELGVDELVVCGLQTEFCVDSTVRHAYALGFPVTLVADANSTYDTDALSARQIIDHHNGVLGSYVNVVDAETVTF